MQIPTPTTSKKWAGRKVIHTIAATTTTSNKNSPKRASVFVTIRCCSSRESRASMRKRKLAM